jgi:hypothetical protein
VIPGRRPERSRALAVGLGLVALYAGLAAWSGRLSPLARGPMLDGLGPLNYRWVAPPPELASTNQPPSAGRFDLPLRKTGVGSQVVFTSDGQVTVVVDEGSIGPAQGQGSVELTVDPLDPAELAPPGGDLAAFGNAYRLAAIYRPSGDRIRELGSPLTVTLLYPATAGLHATEHDLLWSANGRSWEPLETTDAPAAQQASAPVSALGYVLVAGVPVPSPSAAPAAPSAGAGPPPLAVALLVGAGVAMLIGIGLLIRSRSR